MLHILLLSPSLVPADEITKQRAPVVCVVSVKGYIVESQRAGLYLSPESAHAHHISSLQASIIFSPCLWKACIMGMPKPSYSKRHATEGELRQ